MSRPKLTIGMATCKDFDGVYFSLQSILVHHPEVINDVEFVVVDNTPLINYKGPTGPAQAPSPHSRTLKNYLRALKPNGRPIARYIPFTEYSSTACRNLVFEHSNTPFTMCMDSHVLLLPGVIKKLLMYYDNYPNTRNFLQGPMVYDSVYKEDGEIQVSTHMTPMWRSQMYGIWSSDNRGANPENPPFEIPMHGLGLFTCRTTAWLGFNPLFRGFGGEEGYIHEKYRQAGHRNLCLPFLLWNHRFHRPDGVPYKDHLTKSNKIRNYFLGRLELGRPVEDIFEHFVPITNRPEMENIYKNASLEMQGKLNYSPDEYKVGAPRIMARKPVVTP